jgi:site-specific recombinase XerD
MKYCKFRDKGRKHRSCNCPIAVEGTLRGEMIRQSLDVRSWEAAQKIVQEWEVHGRDKSVSILDACDRFISQSEANGLSEDTVKKYKLLKREFEAFFGDVPLRSLSVDSVSQFRESWNMSNISARKKIERLRSFFKFCVDREWIEKNPAKGLKLPKEDNLPTLPFTSEEWEKIRWAVDLYPDRPEGRRKQILAFLLLLRYTGLRIRDVTCLQRNRIQDKKIFLYTQKTGAPVLLPLSDEVLGAVSDVSGTGEYLFWSGNGNPKSSVADWQRSLRKLFDVAGIENGHAHRFRDSFAVELLLHGISLENVAIILGNTARIVEKHYAPWVQARQDALEAAVKMTW